MEFIFAHPYLFGYSFTVLGWILQATKILGDMSVIKGEIVTPRWYIQNRPYKFIGSIILTIMGTVILILTLDPDHIIDGMKLSAFLVGMSVSGVVANKAMDKYGAQVHNTVKDVTVSDVVDNCKTMFKNK